jgi:hypothetical protein
MDNDELLKRIEYMSDIVFPAIKERTEMYNKMMKNQFDKRHRLVDYPIGSFVVVRKKGIQKSLAPVYEGPYEVIRKNDNNNYTLRDEMGLLMPRDFTPSELKLVSQDALIAEEEVYEFDGIVDHRMNNGQREYKIRWKNYTAADDSWITAELFTDPQAVINYWKRVKGSVPKQDAAILAKQLQQESNTPTFNQQTKGNLLQTIESSQEELAKKPTHKKVTSKSRQLPKRTSLRTKTSATHPAQKTFRQTRGNSKRFPVVNDKTRFKK